MARLKPGSRAILVFANKGGVMKRTFATSGLRRQRPFTLIELLTVMVIVSILLGVSMPAFQKLIKGQGVDYAARNIGAKLKIARSYAITQRQCVAVVFPQNSKSGEEYPASTDIPSKYYNCAYRACAVSNPDSGDNEFLYWLEGDKWTFLPTGNAVLEIDDDDEVEVSGGKLSPTNDDNLTLIDGVNFSDIGGGSSVDDVTALVFKPNGRTRGQRYLNIGEAMHEGSGLVMTNPDPMAYYTVFADQFTGRIKYGKEIN